MKRKVWSAVLAVCMIASVVLYGVVASKEIVYADDVSGEIKASSISLDSGGGGVITTDGSLYMWGIFRYGSRNSKIGNRKIPSKIMDGVKQADMESGFYGIIKTDGKLYMWGENSAGQLGDGTTTNREMPVEILNDVVSVDLGDGDGYGCTGAITADGSLYMWGRQDNGLGDSAISKRSSNPVKIMDNVTSVSLGSRHSGALTSDGSLYLWGSNSYLQMGRGAQRAGNLRPEKIMDDVESFSLGADHSAAITKDGSLYVWGANDHGQVGNGKVSEEEDPIKVMNNVAQVVLEKDMSAAVTKDGSLYVWGANNYGQLGNGIKTDCLKPVKILDHVVSVGLAYNHGGAVTADGSLYVWGQNDNAGRLGDGSTEDSLIPKKVNLTNASINMEEEESRPSDEKKVIYTLYYEKSGIYMVNRESNGQCIYYAPVRRDITTATIPSSVTLDGKKYKVTSIYNSAFKDCTKLESVNIGKNMAQIEEDAFLGCKNLKTISIQSNRIKYAGKNCFRGISKKAVIKVPKAKQAAYKKLFRNKGQGSDVKIKGFY